MNLNYTINALSFTSIGLYVAESEGVIDLPAPKEYFGVEWPDAHGLVLDLSRPRYKERVITLDCAMIATGPENLILQLNALNQELRKPGTKRLRINPIGAKPLVYEVYSSGAVEVKKKWRDGKIWAQLTLNLTEPQPRKLVYTATGTASLIITSPSPIALYWGDGTSEYVQGVSQTKTHTYGGSAGATYYLIVSGEIEAATLTNLTNLTLLWDI